ncbi:hypothetical protein FE257_002014 [Aspergillus nanangensis]|uniref:DUF7732 domain-containing protein n=1 Tax=Aspergillus nanangensis TaxID=2582783 RepID=A0AAD4CTL0_ASPNN|nr:hypothetical protein FE257_002014 [Aspergillus nanangensis]
MPPFRLLFTSLLPFGLLLHQLPQARADGLAVRHFTDFPDSPAPLFRLFKRRRGGGDGDSGGSGGSSGGSSGGGSGDDDDDDSGGECVGPVERCTYNRHGYGKFYETGAGNSNSTEGGFTPDGTGSSPSWLERNGQWQYEPSLRFGDEAEGGEGWYLGGSFVPFLSGDKSPNGMEPIELDLNDPGKHTPNLTSSMNSTLSAENWYDPYATTKSCSFSPLLWAYKYPATTNLTYKATSRPTTWASELVNIYCVCKRDALCSCDYPEPNNNFTGALVNEVYASVDLTRSLRTNMLNFSKVCDVHLNGEHAFLIQGGLDHGSTKADPDMERTSDTPASFYEMACPGSCPSGASGLSGLIPSAWIVVLISGLMYV